MMERPYVICHMMTSLDGKIIGHYLQESEEYVQAYFRLHCEMKCDAFLCGRVTMEESFTQGYYPDLSIYQGQTMERVDYLAKTSSFYAVAIDSKGRLGWQLDHIEDEDSGYDQAHIIEVLCENVADEYLCYLRDKGISYIFGGKEKIHFDVVLEKLKRLFQIETLLLEGGGLINGSLAQAELIDELSLLLVPVADCASHSSTLFETGHLISDIHPVHFALKHVETIAGDGLWLRYLRKER